MTCRKCDNIPQISISCLPAKSPGRQEILFCNIMGCTVEILVKADVAICEVSHTIVAKKR